MYDHYIAVDWAQSNMAIARMTAQIKRYQDDRHKGRCWKPSCLLKEPEGQENINY